MVYWWVWYAVVAIVSIVASAALAKTPRSGRPAGLDDVQSPTSSENRAIPFVCGRRWVNSTNCVGFFDLRPKAVNQSMGRKYGLFGPKKKQVINYIYSMGLHVIVCQRADQIRAISISDKKPDMPVVDGTVNSRTVLTFDDPELFGGDKAGGGLVGDIAFEFGHADQTKNGYLQSVVDRVVSAYRNVVGIVVQGAEVTASPPGQGVYVPKIRALVQNVSQVSAWYPEKAAIGTDGDVNPIHVLRLCLVKSRFNNSQYTSGDMGASFITAADTLWDEDFGISCVISSSDVTAEEAVQEIMRHIDGALYEDKLTGKVEVKLNRDDYVVEDLFHIDDASDIVMSVDGYTRTGFGERVNEIAVSYYDVAEDRDRTTTPIQEQGVIELQDGIINEVVPYPFITNAALAGRLTEREIRQQCADLAVVTLVCNRKASHLTIGSKFKWSNAKLGVSNMVLRVIAVSYGSLKDGRVRLETIQDFFSLPQAVYAPLPPPGAVDPINDPEPAAVRAVFEAPYYFVGTGDAAPAPETAGTVMVMAGRPTSDALSFDATVNGEDVGIDGSEFSDHFVLPVALIREELTIISAPIGAVDGLFVVDDEIVSVVLNGANIEIHRGQLDTTPQPHAAGAVAIEILDSNIAEDLYADAASVDVRIMPTTLRGQLRSADAPVDSVTMAHRYVRPSPPGRLRIDGAAYPVSVDTSTVADVVATWAHRDRTLVFDEGLPLQGSGSIGPEPGTTYTARWFLNNALVRTQAGIVGTSDTYTPPVGSGGSEIRVEIETQRDGYNSWQRLIHGFFTRSQLVTEEGDRIVTEEGDPIILE